MAAHVQLQFARLNSWPIGVRAHILWNGRIAGEIAGPLRTCFDGLTRLLQREIVTSVR